MSFTAAFLRALDAICIGAMCGVLFTAIMKTYNYIRERKFEDELVRRLQEFYSGPTEVEQKHQDDGGDR